MTKTDFWGYREGRFVKETEFISAQYTLEIRMQNVWHTAFQKEEITVVCAHGKNPSDRRIKKSNASDLLCHALAIACQK